MTPKNTGSPDTGATSAAAVSVVIPVRNGVDTLAEQLESLVRADKPDGGFEVVVADNGSSDGTAALARSFADRLSVRVVDAGARQSSNFARNCGIAASQFPNILLCDGDDQVDKEWIIAMARALGEGHQLVAGPIDYVLLNPRNVRAWRGADRASVMPVLGFLPAGHGANLGFSRDVFDRLGGFDEDFGFGGEDVEFCWRAQLAGVELHETSDAVVHYRLRGSLAGLFTQSRAYGASEARLFRQFVSFGVRRRRIHTAAHELWWLITRAPFAVPVGRRGAWLRRLGQQVGRFEGSLKYRVWWW